MESSPKTLPTMILTDSWQTDRKIGRQTDTIGTYKFKSGSSEVQVQVSSNNKKAEKDAKATPTLQATKANSSFTVVSLVVTH